MFHHPCVLLYSSYCSFFQFFSSFFILSEGLIGNDKKREILISINTNNKIPIIVASKLYSKLMLLQATLPIKIVLQQPFSHGK